MGKHNGKARSGAGVKVGSALVNRAKKAGRGPSDVESALHRHTTHVAAQPGMQSVLGGSDLTELMTLADLAGRDFTAERGEAVVISTGAVVSDLDRERGALERAEAQARHAHRLRVPRRPAWDRGTSPEELDARERASFLAWRRDLAQLEEDEKLVLTPFEKNIEVWRQLWRVLERSDIVVQVIDARDPLTYRSNDLEQYARDIAPHKGSLLLLNKADLLSAELRTAWADYFDERGVSYVFWSAKAAADAAKQDAGRPQPQRPSSSDPRARVLTVDELLLVFEQEAQEAVDRASPQQLELRNQGQDPGRLVVGLTGYPNVGKSSTINALFGSKKTAVAATPGKTKHFQTLLVGDALMLCDCPGLVLPKYASSKAEMVAAGVIPIDRLTEVRSPMEVVVRKAGVRALEDAYNVRLPRPTAAEQQDRDPTPAEVLRAVAASRGWVVGHGLPDEARAGRAILKDYCDGRLLACEWPPGHVGGERQRARLAAERRRTVPPEAASWSAVSSPADAQTAADTGAAAPAPDTSASQDEDPDTSEGSSSVGAAETRGTDTQQPHDDREDTTSDRRGRLELSAADLELMDDMSISIGTGKQREQRAAHKFQRKPARTKGTRGQSLDGNVYAEGTPFVTGRKGGIKRELYT